MNVVLDLAHKTGIDMTMSLLSVHPFDADEWRRICASRNVRFAEMPDRRIFVVFIESSAQRDPAKLLRALTNLVALATGDVRVTIRCADPEVRAACRDWAFKVQIPAPRTATLFFGGWEPIVAPLWESLSLAQIKR